MTKLMQSSHHYNNVEQLSFAEPIKQIVCKTFGISMDELEYAKNNGRLKAFIKYMRILYLVVDFRLILQRFGTEGTKPIFGDNVWSDLLRSKITDNNTIYIVSDWRFPIEAIDSDIKVHIVNLKSSGTIDSHVSENALVDYKFDFVIDNSGTMEELEQQVEDFLTKAKLL